MSRYLALRILTQVERKGLFAGPLLDHHLERSPLSPLDKALTTELVYGSLRWQSRLDHILSPFLRFPLGQMDLRLRAILRLSVYQLLFLDRIPAFAVVDEAVKMASSTLSRKQGDFVNAVLRKIAQRPPQILPPDPSSGIADWAMYYAHPEDLVRGWVRQFGPEEARALMEADNRIPYLGLQVNLLKEDAASLLKDLSLQVRTAEEGRLVPRFLRVRGLLGIRATRPYQEGWFQIMDEASALIPYLLSPQPGEEVLDACAGKGGKTALLAQLMKDRGRIVAADINGKALRILRENALRLGVTIIEALEGDVRGSERLRGRQFDKILLDAPCSGLGTLARHPEIKWRNPLASLSQMGALQRSLLEGVAKYLRPGGILVYATCSPQIEEDEEVIDHFLRFHPSFALEDLSPYLPMPETATITPRGFLRTFPHRQETDAFFAARLRLCIH